MGAAKATIRLTGTFSSAAQTMTEKQLRLKAADGTTFSLDTIDETSPAQVPSDGKSPTKPGTVSLPSEQAQESPGRKTDAWLRSSA